MLVCQLPSESCAYSTSLYLPELLVRMRLPYLRILCSMRFYDSSLSSAFASTEESHISCRHDKKSASEPHQQRRSGMRHSILENDSALASSGSWMSVSPTTSLLMPNNGLAQPLPHIKPYSLTHETTNPPGTIGSRLNTNRISKPVNIHSPSQGSVDKCPTHTWVPDPWRSTR